MKSNSQQHHTFVSYDIAVQLHHNEQFKEYAGKYFDYYYKNEKDIIPAEESLCLDCNIPAITQSFVQKFFREIYNIIIEPVFDETQNDGYPWLLSIYYNNIDIINEQHELFGDYYDNYEEILEIGIKESLKLI
jgi:hypothetical protein